MRNLWVYDYETEGIQKRPLYPPKPVGVAIQRPGGKARYYSWGHPCNNNSSFEEGQRAVAEMYASGGDILAHNHKFEADVSHVHMGLKDLPWERMHDTMFSLFLQDPYASTFALKPSAERLLNLPPDERDAVRDWLIENHIVTKTDKHWGAHICDAPGDLVGRYAVGDVDRTAQLHKKLQPYLRSMGMLAAYDRERELMPILLANEREGMHIDLPLLEADVARYTEALAKSENWLRKRLKSPSMNIASNEEFADALEKCGVATEFALTKKGNRSVAKDSLTVGMFNDKEVAFVYGYRNRLATCLGTFMEPWLRTALLTGGKIHTNWSQLKQSSSAGDDSGAKTGRMSSSPNFQNIPKEFQTGKDAEGWCYPSRLVLPKLPMIRQYVLPDPGEVFCHRDYAQQEIRILAHYEDADLLAAFQSKHPPLEMCDKSGRIDIHSFVQVNIKKQLGMELSRYSVKTLNFGMLYGMGLKKLAKKLGCSEDEARSIRNAQRKVLSGMQGLDATLKELGRAGDFMRTWGGRVYYQEPSAIVDGQHRDYGYKLLNYLIQGSAADCTKQAMINFYNHPKRTSRLLVAVHDEINHSSKPKDVKRNMKALRESMLDVPGFDVAMISDGKTGAGWGALTKYED